MKTFFFFFFGDHLISAGKTVEIPVKTFFLLKITSYLGPNSSIFSVCFGHHKTGGPSHHSSILSSRGGPSMFVLSPGPRSALGAPGSNLHTPANRELKQNNAFSSLIKKARECLSKSSHALLKLICNFSFRCKHEE